MIDQVQTGVQWVWGAYDLVTELDDNILSGLSMIRRLNSLKSHTERGNRKEEGEADAAEKIYTANSLKQAKMTGGPMVFDKESKLWQFTFILASLQ